MNDAPQGKNRVAWIDCAKAVAIAAVMTDHCYGTAYRNPVIAQASYFSVGLFVLLSGISVWLSDGQGGRITLRHQLKTLWKFVIQYALAVFLVVLYRDRFFDLRTYLRELLSFQTQEPYYFFLFFFQLLLAAPFLIRWCRFCSRFRGWKGAAMQAGTLAVLCIACSLFIRDTQILPVTGGGRYLFGGTYLLLYYLGILLASLQMFRRTKKEKWVILAVSLTAWILWLWAMSRNLLPFDEFLQPYWGEGLNPPGFSLMIFALLTLSACYAGFSLLEDSGLSLKTPLLIALTAIGRSTLYIFLYHLLVADIIGACFPPVWNRVWTVWIFIFLPMLIVPTVVSRLMKKWMARFRNNLYV